MIKTLIASALLTASFSASAAVFELGTLENGNIIQQTSEMMTYGAVTPFVDYFNFSLASTSNASVNATQTTFFNLLNIKDGQVSLFSGKHSDVGATQIGYASNFAASNAFTNLATGNYFYKVTGIVNGPLGGAYTLGTSANVAPVPEPETYALMGMGLLGLLAARRRKAKNT